MKTFFPSNRRFVFIKATIVTLNHEEHLKTEAGHIRILPAWLWALSLKNY